MEMAQAAPESEAIEAADFARDIGAVRGHETLQF